MLLEGIFLQSTIRSLTWEVWREYNSGRVIIDLPLLLNILSGLLCIIQVGDVEVGVGIF